MPSSLHNKWPPDPEQAGRLNADTMSQSVCAVTVAGTTRSCASMAVMLCTRIDARVQLVLPFRTRSDNSWRLRPVELIALRRIDSGADLDVRGTGFRVASRNGGMDDTWKCCIGERYFCARGLARSICATLVQSLLYIPRNCSSLG